MENIRRFGMMGIVLWGLLIIGNGRAMGEASFELSRFIAPETCGDCHGEIYRQWENSLHNLSQKDPIYLSVSKYLLTGLTHKDEIAEAESCVKCHVPVGYITGYPMKLSDAADKIPPLPQKGIQCDYCHSAVDVEKMYNNGLKLSPGHGEDQPGAKGGPFKDSDSDFHECRYSELHTDSAICGTCHNVKHVSFNTDLETTYEEWKNGPYNSPDLGKKVTCQGCHMYQRPGIPATGSTPRPKNKGAAVDDGPKREHIFTHYFVGGNGYIPGSAGDKVKEKMAEDRLKNAASLSIDASRTGKGEIIVKTTNTGAGHYLPTGLTDIRQLWLEVIVKNQKGETVFSTGTLDANGYIPEGTILFNTVFGDGKGQPVENIAKAREVLKDKRIPPLSSLSETLRVPMELKKGIIIYARLLYRVAPQKVIDTVLGKGKVLLPVITVAEAKAEIK